MGGDAVGHGQQVEQADQKDQRRIFEEADELADDGGDDQPQRLGHDNQPILVERVESEGIGRFILPFGDGLQPTAHIFGEIRGRKKRRPHQHPRRVQHFHVLRQENGEQNNGHEQHRDKWHTTPDFDEDGAKRGHDIPLKRPLEQVSQHRHGQRPIGQQGGKGAGRSRYQFGGGGNQSPEGEHGR